ncbi:MAG: porphobilinogen synthase [Thermoproteota archaeon]|nr:porphobilinogen synthase [Thermoproteota archaeon]
MFPKMRLRRLRKSEAIRDLLQETRLSAKDFVYPLFIQEGLKKSIEIESMPGIFRFPIEKALDEIEQVVSLGIKAVILFGIPKEKDQFGKASFDNNGTVQKAVKMIKDSYGGSLAVITDVCLCQYTSHGHCGILSNKNNNKIDNDETTKVLSKVALSHAESGADIVAPSAMMDGQVKMIRDILDANNYEDTLIMGYSAKQASSFFSPFRDAAHSTPGFGDRKSYQMPFSNAREASREVFADMEEGADILMIKPAIPNLDLIHSARNSTLHPIAAYSVSGEYSMIKAAALNNWIDEISAITEMLTGIKRAGADIIISYYAKKMAEVLKSN